MKLAYHAIDGLAIFVEFLNQHSCLTSEDVKDGFLNCDSKVNELHRYECRFVVVSVLNSVSLSEDTINFCRKLLYLVFFKCE